MKYLTLLILSILMMSFNIKAETCSAVIRDRSGYELERYNSDGYNRDAACSEAMYQCNRSLSDARANGRYYDAICEVEPIFYPNPNPYPNPNTDCQTDLIDQWGTIVRTFTGYGRNNYEACAQSVQFCRDELYRNTSYGARCITRNGPNPNPYPNPYPPRTKTESCQASRFDPAGMFIQSYFANATGPYNSDVRQIACGQALSQCQRDLKGRQFCNITR